MTKKRKISFAVLAVLLSAATVVSGWMIVRELYDRQKEKEDFVILTELVEVPPTEENNPPVPDETQPPESTELQRDLSELFAQNSDCIGWLCIPDTAVNYPVMYTPQNPQKYLRRNFYGEYSQSGVPFLDYRCSLDSGNLIFYGHNMKNGTMFSDLKHYTDSAFRNTHSTISFQTADGIRFYTVCDVRVTNTSDAWYNRISESSDRFFVLSTCYGGAKNGRILIIAKEVS